MRVSSIELAPEKSKFLAVSPAPTTNFRDGLGSLRDVLREVGGPRVYCGSVSFAMSSSLL